MKQRLKTGQRLRLSPHLIQYNAILQMSGNELAEHIKSAALENPLIDLDTALSADRADSFSACGSGGKFAGASESALAYRDFETLADDLKSQLYGKSYAREEWEVIDFLLASLDEHGFLTESPAQAAAVLNKDLSLTRRIAGDLRKLDPPGICAYDFRDCLKLQLERANRLTPCMTLLIDRYLPHIALRQFRHISSETGLPLEETLSLCRRIRELDPYPCKIPVSGSSPRYLLPDIVISSDNTGFYIELPGARIPRIEINPNYRLMLASTDDEQLRAYLSERFGQAVALQKCIQKRQMTLLGISDFLLDFQKSFFLYGCGHIQKLLMSDAAKELGMSVSAVSRAVRGKYLQCRHGVFPLHYFFCREGVSGADGQACSQDAVLLEVREMISCENKAHPLSDQSLADRLNQKGIRISRRTVAKYRMQARIPSATQRRGYFISSKKPS